MLERIGARLAPACSSAPSVALSPRGAARAMSGASWLPEAAACGRETLVQTRREAPLRRPPRERTTPRPRDLASVLVYSLGRRYQDRFSYRTQGLTPPVHKVHENGSRNLRFRRYARVDDKHPAKSTFGYRRKPLRFDFRRRYGLAHRCAEAPTEAAMCGREMIMRSARAVRLRRLPRTWISNG